MPYPVLLPLPASRPVSGAAARRLAVALREASASLERLAARLEARRAAARAHPAALEYHAEAGAPEGALYVDGRLVGWLPVSRL